MRKGFRRVITRIQLRKIVKDIIIKKKGNVLSKDITPLYEKYYIGDARFGGFNNITMAVQGELNYFRYSPSQAAFRKKYNWR